MEEEKKKIDYEALWAEGWSERLKNWRSWGSWFSWGSPVGLGLFFIAIGILAILLRYAFIVLQ